MRRLCSVSEQSGGLRKPTAGPRKLSWISWACLVLAAHLPLLAGCNMVDRMFSGAPVWTDGVFDDWEGVEPAANDRTGDAPRGSPVDLGPVSLRDDPRFLHILIDLGRTVTAQGMAGSVEVVLDADGDAATGGPYGGVEGADLAIVLSRDAGADGDRHGAGVGIRRIGPEGAGEVEGSAGVGLLVAPTHSSDRFEVRVRRGAVREVRREVGEGPDAEASQEVNRTRPPLPLAMDSVVIGRVRFVRGGDAVDETPLFTHVLATKPGGEPPLLGVRDVARARGAYRVVVWNVSDRSFRENRRAFQRVLAALGADVVLLDEVYADVTMAELGRFGAGMAGGGEAGGARDGLGGGVAEDTRGGQGGGRAARASAAWTWWLASGGGRQRTVVGARGLDLRGETSLSRIDHAPGALEGWLGEVGDEPGARGMALPSELAMAEEEGGLSATGAWVTIEGRDVLFVPVDLQSAGYDGSPRDRLRELQARTLNQAVAAALARRPAAGLVIGGDLNLVGSARPLDELRRGPGSDGGDLEASAPDLSVVRLERLRDRSLATWRSTWRDDPFSPGRLDFVLYRSAVLEVAQAFVFDAADLSADALRELGLRRSDTDHSDHLPLVVDFRVR